jgi:hypothetical protein
MVDSAVTALFDADNHYWETKDAFARHRAPKFADLDLQVKEIVGVLRYVVRGEVFQGLPGPGDSEPENVANFPLEDQRRIMHDNAYNTTMPTS